MSRPAYPVRMATTEARSIPAPSTDVQAGRPATEVSLTRVGVPGVEKVIKVAAAPGNDGTPGDGQLYFAELECMVDLNPQQAGVHMSRFEEVVNEAIDGVVLDQTLRAEELAGRIAEQVRERQDGLRAEVTDRRPLSGDGVHPGLGHRDPGDLHPVRDRGRLRARHPDPDRGRGPGDDRLPLRPGAARRLRPRAAGRRRLRRATRSSASSRPSPSPPTTSAGSARCTSAASRAPTSPSTRATCWRSSSRR